ncbi:MAG TPA: SDR family oxidoreductase, partial [bacterium]|nr:SDR family oxidoreductase [bacterium]
MNPPAPPRVLVTGSAGFLGWHLARLLAARGGEVLGTVYRRRPAEAPFPVRLLDIRARQAVASVIGDFRPRFVVHAAAVISPAVCSADPVLARAVNAEGTEFVATAARAAGAVTIFTSTDRVFDGERGRYREEDVPRPLGPYGKSKLDGEEAVRAADPGNIVVRLPLMYGMPSPCHAPFTGWMLESFRGGGTMDLFLDQYRTPALVDDVAEAVARIVERPPSGGIYHLGGPERV